MKSFAKIGFIEKRLEHGSPVEWWFVHGRFQGEGLRRRYFMVSLFRIRVPGKKKGPGSDVFAALLSVLDPRSGKQRTSSRIDRGLLEAFTSEPVATRLDPQCPSSIFDELRAYGLPREFEMPETGPELSRSPFCCRWADLLLTAKDDGLMLSFREPGTRRRCQLRLTLQAPGIMIAGGDRAGRVEGGMHVATYPKLLLRGRVGSVSVHGEAWFDHQWGSEKWFRTGDASPRALGWDWLGFNLNDGSSWIVHRQWDVDTRTEFKSDLTVRLAGDTVVRSNSFAWTPTRYWTSPATRTRYPLEWYLEVPELETRLHFRPFSDDQEIRVFGSIRAIWEGAGVIQGWSRGKPVRGWARLEGHGYAYISSARDYLNGWAEEVDEELALLLPRTIAADKPGKIGGQAVIGYEPSAYVSTLAQPLWDLMDRDGKRWRGIFTGLMLEAFGTDPTIYRSVIFAWPELLHNASLIIDDLQDGSLIRRGEETIHLRYGTDIAVSAANTAYFLSLFPVLNHARLSGKQKLAMCSIYQRLMFRAHLGQSLDLFWTRNLSESRLRDWMQDSMGDKIRQMYLYKTAGPVEGLAEVAALIARVKQKTRVAGMAFARAFGLGYQMIDDINNFSASPRWGKQRGEDLAGGKITYLIFHALQLLGPSDRNRLQTILCDARRRQEPAIRMEGIDLVVRSGACEKVRREAREMVEHAWKEYSRHVQPSTAKWELRLMWENLLDLC